MKTIVVDGVEFVEKANYPKCERAIVVVDRGWIFAGDVRRENGRIYLTRAVHVFRWESIGFDGMVADPKSSKVTLKAMTRPVEIPQSAEVFCVPVDADWGI
jgi:hypothetical protein